MRIPIDVLEQYREHMDRGQVIEIVKNKEVCYCFERQTDIESFEPSVEISIQKESSTGEPLVFDRGIKEFKMYRKYEGQLITRVYIDENGKKGVFDYSKEGAEKAQEIANGLFEDENIKEIFVQKINTEVGPGPFDYERKLGLLIREPEELVNESN